MAPTAPKLARRIGDVNALNDAIYAVDIEGMRPHYAARLFRVSPNTLRRRLIDIGVVDITDHHAGSKKTMLSKDQEKKLANHFERMAGFGYGYTQQEIIEIATQYLGGQYDKLLTHGWYNGFILRWPQMGLGSSRLLDIYTAKAATTPQRQQ